LSLAKLRTDHDDIRIDPYRLYLVVRRGAFTDLSTSGELAGAATVACVRDFKVPDEWRSRPGKVTLRARTGGQWEQVLELPHACAGDAVAALPPMRRSERPPLLTKLQAMSTELEPPPASAPRDHRLTYVLNPRIVMSSGKTLAQIAHAAVMAAESDALGGWVAGGCPARVVMPADDTFEALCASSGLAARVVDAGLTEVAPGTVTVLALFPGDAPG
jgi:peptidyl-tRNA hydrolase